MPSRPLLLIVTVLVAMLVAAGCGSGGRGADGGEGRVEAPADGAAGSDGAETPAPGSREAGEARLSGGAFSISRQLAACMQRAGFAPDAPPTGGLAAWRHPSGGRVVVASGTEVTDGIADEIGSKHPAEVSGHVVVAAPAEHATAADDCLRRFAG